jgi:hypothetical protein
VTTWLTVEELAERQRRPADEIRELLRDERKRGHVEHRGGGRWAASEQFVETFGAAFAEIQRPVNGISAFTYDSGRDHASGTTT